MINKLSNSPEIGPDSNQKLSKRQNKKRLAEQHSIVMSNVRDIFSDPEQSKHQTRKLQSVQRKASKKVDTFLNKYPEEGFGVIQTFIGKVRNIESDSDRDEVIAAVMNISENKRGTGDCFSLFGFLSRLDNEEQMIISVRFYDHLVRGLPKGFQGNIIEIFEEVSKRPGFDDFLLQALMVLEESPKQLSKIKTIADLVAYLKRDKDADQMMTESKIKMTIPSFSLSRKKKEPSEEEIST